MDIKVIGVIGAGVIGTGVAQNFIQMKHHVILIDLSTDILEHARENITNNIRLDRIFATRKDQENIDSVMERILFSTDYKTLANAEFVVENVTEKWDIKKEIYPQIDCICQHSCIFAVNTSAISITRIASLTNRPKQVIGMHFMNPVPMKKMVEVIRGYHTSSKTIEAACAFLASMGKESIVVNDMPGFVTNRVLMLTVNEAIFLVQDRVATAEEVDIIFKTCIGHKMGPLETADLIGLDTILYSIEVLYESYNDSKYKPCPLLKKMVDAGLYGRKSGKGFYTYS
jgi:3-hydroxybutyryl-CoA dehydrogenase